MGSPEKAKQLRPDDTVLGSRPTRSVVGFVQGKRTQTSGKKKRGKKNAIEGPAPGKGRSRRWGTRGGKEKNNSRVVKLIVKGSTSEQKKKPPHPGEDSMGQMVTGVKGVGEIVRAFKGEKN